MKRFLFTLIISMIACSGYAQTPVFVGPRGNSANDPANGVYVSPSGNDQTGNGSIDRPYKSINFALGKVSSGATIILRGGTYREGRRVRVNKSNITIKSAKGEWAIIDLTTYDAGNQEHSGVEFYAEDIEDTNVPRGVVKNCKLQSVEVKGGFYAVCFETQWEWGKGIRDGASNNIVEDCILHHSTNDCVKIKPGCDNNTIRYCEIHHSGQSYINHVNFTTGKCNSEGIDNVNGDKMHVHNNYIHDICSNGIYAKGGAMDALIEYNIIDRTYGTGIALGFDTSPQFFDLTVNPKYYENINGIVRNNLVMNTGWEGIGLYASKDAQVYNNTIINATGYGTATTTSPEPVVRCAIYFGIVTQDYGNPNGCPPNINPTIHHNLISQPSSKVSEKMVEIRYVKPGDVYATAIPGISGKPTMNYNCYYASGKSATFTNNCPPEVKNISLSAWKTHIGGEANSIEVNPSLGADYMPTNSQCAGMGITAPLKINDGTGAPKAPLSETFASISNGVLYINNPFTETVQGYSITGAILFNIQKQEGNVSFSMNQPIGTVVFINGSSGWTKKLIVR